jgi:hypothetical protein
VAEREALMHLDGCHFYVWVLRDPDGSTVLTFAEREGTNLRLHGRFGRDGDDVCERCRALRHGAARRSVSKHIDPLPDDPRETFLTVAGLVGEIDERYGLAAGDTGAAPEEEER